MPKTLIGLVVGAVAIALEVLASLAIHRIDDTTKHGAMKRDAALGIFLVGFFGIVVATWILVTPQSN